MPNNILYNQYEPITFSVSADQPLEKVEYLLDGSSIGFGYSPPNYNFIYTPFRNINTYSVSAIGYTLSCSASTSSTLYVSQGPYVSFSNLTNNQYVQEGMIDLNITSYSQSLGQVSAVSVSSDRGDIGAATLVDNITWSVPFNIINFDSYSLSATAIDTLGQIGQTSILINVLKKPTTSFTVSGTNTPTLPANSNTTFTVTSTSNNGGTITSVELYYGETKLDDFVVSGSNWIVSYPTYEVGSGVKVFTAKVVDSLGSTSYTNLTATIPTYAGSFSRPSIVLKSSIPESKVSNDSVESIIEVSDYVNGIIPERIIVKVGATIIGLEEVIPYKVYNVKIQVSKSTSVVIEAQNYIGVKNTLTTSNYVIKCDSGRKIKLTNYLPEFLKSGVGNQLEYFKFVEFFENTLNTIYNDIDNGCNIGVLEKSSRLVKLHDIDKIEQSYIPYLSNMLGYDVGLNREEIGSYAPPSSDYEDSTDEYVDKILRFVVGNLPSSYNMKTTRNAIKVLLLSYGIVGNSLELYTNDYKDVWVTNNYTSGSYVSDDVDDDFYPTPHIAVGIDLRNTPTEIVSSSLANVMKAVESIRPVNIVIDGITGYASKVLLPSPTVNLKFNTTKVISIGKECQQSPFKA